MNRRQKITVLAALVMVLLVTVPRAYSYFTAYVRLQGKVTISLQDSSVIEEPSVEQGIKHVMIKADDDSDPIFIRVRVFAADEVEISTESAGWTLSEDGYYYYDTPIDGKADDLFQQQVALELSVKLPADASERYNVIVIYEASPALQDENGQWYADWNQIIGGGQ